MCISSPGCGLSTSCTPLALSPTSHYTGPVNLFTYSTHQVQGIRQTRLPSCVNVFVSLYKPIYLCIYMYKHVFASVYKCVCLLFTSSCKPCTCNLHEPYTCTLYLMRTVIMKDTEVPQLHKRISHFD